MANIWPNNPWYAPYLDAAPNVPVYYPTLNIGGSAFGGPGFFWDQRPSAEAFSVQASQTKGSHFLKYGFQFRRGGGPVFVSDPNNFYFNQPLTANTYINPDLTKSGDPFATFLLGALGPDSQMVGGPAPEPLTDFFGFYIGDDWRLTVTSPSMWVSRTNTKPLGMIRSTFLRETSIFTLSIRRLPPTRLRCRRRSRISWAPITPASPGNGILPTAVIRECGMRLS